MITKALVLAAKTVAAMPGNTRGYSSPQQAELVVHRLSGTLGLGAGAILSAAAGGGSLPVSPLSSAPTDAVRAAADMDIDGVRTASLRLARQHGNDAATLQSSPLPVNGTVRAAATSRLLWRVEPAD